MPSEEQYRNNNPTQYGLQRIGEAYKHLEGVNNSLVNPINLDTETSSDEEYENEEQNNTQNVQALGGIQNSQLLSNLHPQAKPKLVAFLNELVSSGMKVIITSGYRNIQDQRRVCKSYSGTCAQPGRSPHSLGVAIDINVTLPNGKRLMLKTPNHEWQPVVAIAKKHGLVWNRADTMNDPVHFQVPLGANKNNLLAQVNSGKNYQQLNLT